MNAPVIAPFVFDWKTPDYAAVFRERFRRLKLIRATPGMLTRLKLYYSAADDPDQLGNRLADFINDWGMTFDPRNADVDLPTSIPFMIFPKQREWIVWLVERWRSRQRGIAEKSRDMGISWLAVSTAASLCLLRGGMTIGFGSRTEDDVDLIGSPDCLFWKARFFVTNLPPEFRGSWNEKQNSAHMRIGFPETNSVITGDAGKNIGRGGRSAIFFVDESASLEQPMLTEASLSQTTNCRIDISTPKGRNNVFAQKRFEGKIPVFTFHWRDDPRKDEAWYADQQDKLDPVTLAQEVDLNYDASTTGILIPSAWVQAAVDADKKLGFEITGQKIGALDVADEGIDLNAFAVRHGVLVKSVTAWSGKGDDIFGSVQTAFRLCDENDIRTFYYDADGLGAGVRGDARVINAKRGEDGVWTIEVGAFRGSGEVYRPDAPIPTATAEDGEARDRRARKNKDFFANAKAQAWWDLRVRFQRTYRAVTAGSLGKYSPDDLISLSSAMSELAKVTQELSQPTYTINTAGKVLVDKQPDGTRSPNHGDGVMIVFAPRKYSFLKYLD